MTHVRLLYTKLFMHTHVRQLLKVIAYTIVAHTLYGSEPPLSLTSPIVIWPVRNAYEADIIHIHESTDDVVA